MSIFWRKAGLKDALSVLHTMRDEKQKEIDRLEALEGLEEDSPDVWMAIDFLGCQVTTIGYCIEEINKEYERITSMAAETN